MSETVRELLKRLREPEVAAHKEVTKLEPQAEALNKGFSMGAIYVGEKFKPILDYHIIPGADAVVTKESLLAAALAYEKAHHDALDTDDYEVGLLAGARAFIEACGMEFAKEVVIVEGRYIPSTRLVGRTPLLIKRKED